MSLGRLSLLVIVLVVAAFGQRQQQQHLATTETAVRALERNGRQSIIPVRSQYTDGNVYDILAVTMLAGLGSFLIPSFSTFMTYMVASNRVINPNQSQKTSLLAALSKNRVRKPVNKTSTTKRPKPKK